MVLDSNRACLTVITEYLSMSSAGVEEDTHTYAAHRREHSYDVSVGYMAPVRSLLAQRWATSRILSYSCALDFPHLVVTTMAFQAF